jgi:hypothetical protein
MAFRGVFKQWNYACGGGGWRDDFCFHKLRRRLDAIQRA